MINSLLVYLTFKYDPIMTTIMFNFVQKSRQLCQLVALCMNANGKKCFGFLPIFQYTSYIV